ncbi:hypothetical protein D3C79_861290 [compost metagenome]
MAPSSSTSSISTVISLPTLRASLRTETCCCSSTKRWKRSSWTSSGTGSGSSLALAPSTGLYLKQPTRSSSALSMKSSSIWNSSSVSPGKPTMKVERRVISGQISRHFWMRSRVRSTVPGRFISFRMRGLACCSGMSR